MSDYEPGTVAVATVKGVEGVRVFRRKDHHGTERWETAENLSGWLGHDDSDVTDVRPLVVLDLDECYGCWAVDQRSPSIIATQLRETNSVAAHAIADQIEAQTKPPRIPEPKGVGALVRSEGRLYAAAEDGMWVSLGDGSSGRREMWSFLIDPALIREGLS